MGSIFKTMAIIGGAVAIVAIVILVCDDFGWQTERLATLHILLRVAASKIAPSIARSI
jgi:hypothetical protein